MRARFDQLDDAQGGELSPHADAFAVERLERQLLARRVLAALGERDRTVLRLHYYERLTAPEIAERLATTAGYAEKLIVKALQRARRLFTIAKAWPSLRADIEGSERDGIPGTLRVDTSASLDFVHARKPGPS